jgi:hypothetical protein
VTLVKIKIAQFQYHEEVGGTKRHKRTGEELPLLATRFARHGQTVDITRDEDLERGEKLGAFEDEAPEDEASEEAEPTNDEAVDEEIEEVSWRHDDLVAWIRDDKPTASEVVKAAEGNPEYAKKLIAAEEEASGSQPRKSVVDPLRKIAGE